MNIVRPQIEIYKDRTREEILCSLEIYGRTCYKSEDKITPDSAAGFVKRVIGRGHESVIEHEKISVRVIIDRGVSHEWVRHRIGSYSQESTRYCSYYGDIDFILPLFFEDDPVCLAEWKLAMEEDERHYNNFIKMGRKPEEARCVLAISLKTEFVVTFNLREWRWFFRKRADSAAHPQMREVSIPLLLEFNRYLPEVFEDLVALLPLGSDKLYSDVVVSTII